MAINRVFILLMMVIACLTSCSTNGCHENRSSIAKAGLYAYNRPAATVAIDSISLYGIGQKSDALILDCAQGVTSLTLPFRNDADTTQFVIRYDAGRLAAIGLSDTLTIYYTRYPYFISGDCGVVFNYHIDTLLYTVHGLDSVALMVDEVTNQDIETIRLYYYVAE